MKTPTFFTGILCIVIMASLCSCDPLEDNDLTNAGLSGMISSLTQQTYHAAFKFGEWTTGMPFSSQSPAIEHVDYDVNSYTFLFNEDGILIDEDYHNYYRARMLLNEENQVTERNAYNGDGSLLRKIEYTYDENGKEISGEIYMSNGDLYLNYENIYDGDKKSKENQYNSSGELIQVTSYTYDESDNVILETIYRTIQEDTTKRIEYSYGEHGNLIEVKYTNRTYTYEWNEWEYNERDLPSKEIEYDREGNVLHEYSIIYDFDEADNWIKKTMIEDGDPKIIRTRVIIYYE